VCSSRRPGIRGMLDHLINHPAFTITSYMEDFPINFKAIVWVLVDEALGFCHVVFSCPVSPPVL
jgi:hypothetical protein